MSVINKTLSEKKFLTKFSYDRKFWFYIFQLESIKVTQFNKLLLSNNKLVVPNELISAIKYGNYDREQKYFFNYFISKQQLLLRDLVRNNFYFISSSVLPLDSIIQVLFFEIRKKLLFLYNNSFSSFFAKLNLKSIKDMYNQKLDLLSELYNVSFSLSDRYFLKNIFFVEKVSNNLHYLSNFEIYLSCDFLYHRLRSLGFIHSLRNRPVSNPKYLLLSDTNIIRIFSYYAISILNWFSCVNNISDTKYVVELLRQSCFLTLCRKHNKRKAWALDVFTSDLLIVESLCCSSLVFPRKSLLLNLKRNFSFYHSQLYFNESFFL